MPKRLEPQITSGETSPLSSLIGNALRQWGSTHLEAVDADTIHMFLGFANQIIQDVNQHPYREGMTRLDFFRDVRETRPIPDLIITTGLLHYYAQQQHSERVSTLSPQYFRNLNGLLWDELNGNTRIETRPRDHTGRSSVNGLPE